MNWVSVAELKALSDPHQRMAAESHHMQMCMHQAKLEQAERHHSERQLFETNRLETGIAASEALERVKGGIALELATRTHALEMAAKSSSLLDESWLGIVRQEEAWNSTFADTMRQLVVIEADTLRQERLRKLDQLHALERTRLESNLRIVEAVATHELLSLRVAFDKAADIIFRLVERALGLGPLSVEEGSVRDWVREAMEQTGEAC